MKNLEKDLDDAYREVMRNMQKIKLIKDRRKIKIKANDQKKKLIQNKLDKFRQQDNFSFDKNLNEKEVSNPKEINHDFFPIEFIEEIKSAFEEDMNIMEDYAYIELILKIQKEKLIKIFDDIDEKIDEKEKELGGYELTSINTDVQIDLNVNKTINSCIISDTSTRNPLNPYNFLLDFYKNQEKKKYFSSINSVLDKKLICEFFSENLKEDLVYRTEKSNLKSLNYCNSLKPLYKKETIKTVFVDIEDMKIDLSNKLENSMLIRKNTLNWLESGKNKEESHNSNFSKNSNMINEENTKKIAIISLKKKNDAFRQKNFIDFEDFSNPNLNLNSDSIFVQEDNDESSYITQKTPENKISCKFSINDNHSSNNKSFFYEIIDEPEFDKIYFSDRKRIYFFRSYDEIESENRREKNHFYSIEKNQII